ncbi:hypothetical protein [Salmonirosea aquatica]|uniref:Uncharacterized protein n=1 Tax=Salmonirosea aquatica TaxID=2654236 RepID=A0A7C9F415_9BACT|nr:hypothetical protein [Cytophagaceae bacterium SJW1-29]
MKQIAATAFFFLLLIHMLGQTVSVWCLEAFYNTPNSGVLSEERIVLKVPFAIPYGTTWNNDAPEGLVHYEGDFYNIVEQRYENDSLYTVMQANFSAREQFFALAERIQQEFGHNVNKSGNPLEKSTKVFSTAIKHYLSTQRRVTFYLWELMEGTSMLSSYPVNWSAYDLSPATPPPDLV